MLIDMEKLNKEDLKRMIMETIQEMINPQDFEYVSILQEHVSNCLNGKYAINETRGINKDIDFIVQKIIGIIKNNIHHFRLNEKETFTNVRTKEDYFIDYVNFDVTFSLSNNDKYQMRSFFNDEECKFVKNHNDKVIMLYPYFSFNETIPSIVNRVVLNEQVFSTNIWHEAMHCYRTYRIYLDNDGIYPDSLNTSDIRYRKSTDMIYKSSNNACGRIARWIGNCYYKMNKNEIAAQVSSVYGYIQNNKEITVNNYKDYLDELDIKKTYNAILVLYNYIEEIRNRDKEDNERKCVVSILRYLFKMKKENDTVVLKRTSNNIKYYLSYINSKMYAAIEYSLMVLKRNGITAEMYEYSPELIEMQDRPKWEDD